MSSRSGFVFLLALIVVLVVSAICVTVSRGVGLRLAAERDATARARCRAAALGVLRAVVNDLDTALVAGGPPTLRTVTAAGEPVGGCTVLLIGRDPAGAAVTFGLIPEAGKLDLANTPPDILAALPGMTPALGAAIGDWRDADDEPDRTGGAERSDGAYAGAAIPYAPRNAPFATVEELRLVRDVTDTVYFGEDANQNGMLDAGEDTDGNGALTPGLCDLLSLENREPLNAPDGSTRINVRSVGQPLRSRLVAVLGEAVGEQAFTAATAASPFNNRLELLAALSLPEAAASTLWPMLIENMSGSNRTNRLGLVDPWSCPDAVLTALVGSDIAKRLIAARPAMAPASPGWIATALGRRDAAIYGGFLTWGSYQFQADLLAVDDAGTGWVRLRASIDCSNGFARVTRLADTTTAGWPLPGTTPDDLRAGTGGSDVATYLTTRSR